MDTLWAPWRIEYITGPKPDACIFCVPKDTAKDAERLILYRGAYSFVIMNKYPYNSGHLMVVPYRHCMELGMFSPRETAELMSLLQHTTAILTRVLNAEGMNIGLNLGEAAGAGIREHLHFHVVPRWNGDSSFMPVTAATRTMPQHLAHTYATLLPHFSSLKTSRP